jgi:hypothetical protein
MAALLTNATADGAGATASMSGPATVYLRGTFAGARVAIQIADEDVAASFVKPDVSAMPESHATGPRAFTLSAYGAYKVRATLA